jgi:hypothetical protein
MFLKFSSMTPGNQWHSVLTQISPTNLSTLLTFVFILERRIKRYTNSSADNKYMFGVKTSFIVSVGAKGERNY